MAIRELRPAQVGGGSALGLLAAAALREFGGHSATASILADVCESVDDATAGRLAEEIASRTPAAVWAALAGFLGAYLGCTLAWRRARRTGGPPPLRALGA